MVNTVILGDCLYKKSSAFRRCKITTFNAHAQVPKTRIFVFAVRESRTLNLLCD